MAVTVLDLGYAVADDNSDNISLNINQDVPDGYNVVVFVGVGLYFTSGSTLADTRSHTWDRDLVNQAYPGSDNGTAVTAMSFVALNTAGLLNGDTITFTGARSVLVTSPGSFGKTIHAFAVESGAKPGASWDETAGAAVHRYVLGNWPFFSNPIGIALNLNRNTDLTVAVNFVFQVHNAANDVSLATKPPTTTTPGLAWTTLHDEIASPTGSHDKCRIESYVATGETPGSASAFTSDANSSLQRGASPSSSDFECHQVFIGLRFKVTTVAGGQSFDRTEDLEKQFTASCADGTLKVTNNVGTVTVDATSGCKAPYIKCLRENSVFVIYTRGSQPKVAFSDDDGLTGTWTITDMPFTGDIATFGWATAYKGASYPVAMIYTQSTKKWKVSVGTVSGGSISWTTPADIGVTAKLAQGTLRQRPDTVWEFMYQKDSDSLWYIVSCDHLSMTGTGTWS